MKEILISALTGLIFAATGLTLKAPDSRLAAEEHLKPALPLYGPPDTSSIVVIGDVMLHSRQMEYDYQSFLESIRPLLENADLSIANMEFPLAGEPYTGYPSFSAPDKYAQYVRDCGVDVFLAANNHILDKGDNGLERTCRIYGEMERNGEIRFTGISSDASDDKSRYPLIVNIRGTRIAFLNFTYGTNCGSSKQWPKVNRMDTTDISAAIARAKEQKPDFIIALPHWGTEYRLKHSPRQETLAKWLVDKGIDAIIGAHPHVVQDSSNIDGVPVFYSVGNAVSNMSATDTQIELAVKLQFAKDINGDKSMLKPEVTYLWCSLPDRFRENYATIPVAEYIGKRTLWRNPADYDKMMNTYRRVKSETGVNDGLN